MPDPRIVTAIAYYIIGMAGVTLAFRVWTTHPINRVFSLGPFVTEAGLRFLLENVRPLFALGMFALASGASRHMYWLAARGCPTTHAGSFFALVETIFAVWAACCVIIAAWRLCRKV